MLKSGDLDPGLDTQRGIKIGKRFIEQEYSGFAHDRATYGDTLPLPAGEVLRMAT
ncbi:hypothetical protein WGT02_29120 (plasmid) [Rhizobium sp. T1470]|uniref:hypothetical protein n=1 Tax=Rhizobium sp. T1470 TaxID=555320 RepID=UPI0032471682